MTPQGRVVTRNPGVRIEEGWALKAAGVRSRA